MEYLPKYWPDLNPIEMSFAKLKARLRKLARRTVFGLRRGIAAFIPSVSAPEASNYFHQVGYGAT